MLPQTNLKKPETHPKLSTLVGLMSSLSLLIIFYPHVTFAGATSTCGDIITSENATEIRTPIDDCADPFNLKISSEERNFPYSLNDQVLTAGEVRTVDSFPALIDLPVLELSPNFNFFSFSLYRHEGEDYRLLEQVNYNRPLDIVLQANATGTYTIVTSFENVEVASKNSVDINWWQRFVDWFVGKAYASVMPAPPDPKDLLIRSALTFTLKLPDKPVGASSVLFLPGIQASRLYKEGVFNTEDQLWEPNINNDVEQLAMTDTGSSVNDIYTRDVIDEIIFPKLGGNVYKSFLEKLENMKEDEVIADFTTFAYDWRYGVDDIVANGTRYKNETKNLLNIVKNLADNSFTGKVTIVGHSNGGLLAETLISELKKLGKANLVDKVVFVGVPQLGSAKAMGVLLHGLQQQKIGGLVVDDETARNVVKNMAGVYALLPSQRYYQLSDTPLITNVGDLDTAGISEYGVIDSLAKFSNFALDTLNLRDDDVPVYTPNTLNFELLSKMIATRTKFDNWSAPAGVKVYEIVGTGVATIKGYEYRNFPCINLVCAFGSYAKPYPIFTTDGDETVTTFSAEAYGGDKVTGVVDLAREGAQLSVITKRHTNLTESPTVQEYLDAIIRFPYLNETLEIPQDNIEVATKYTIISTHSPVEISLQTADGKRVGKFDDAITEEINGSQYFELGGSSYLIVPADLEYEVTVSGKDDGVYSLVIDSLDEEDRQTNLYTYLGASTTPEMSATFRSSSTNFSNITTDLDGDGVIDLVKTLNGEDIEVVSNYSYPQLATEIKLLGLPRIYERILLLQIRLAEHWSEKGRDKLELAGLRKIKETLTYYHKKGLIDTEEYVLLKDIINHLIN